MYMYSRRIYIITTVRYLRVLCMLLGLDFMFCVTILFICSDCFFVCARNGVFVNFGFKLSMRLVCIAINFFIAVLQNTLVLIISFVSTMVARLRIIRRLHFVFYVFVHTTCAWISLCRGYSNLM